MHTKYIPTYQKCASQKINKPLLSDQKAKNDLNFLTVGTGSVEKKRGCTCSEFHVDLSILIPS